MKPKSKAAGKNPVALTLRLEMPLFLRLKVFGAKERRSNQDILHTALREYLTKMKA
jgi:hypothetical protein